MWVRVPPPVLNKQLELSVKKRKIERPDYLILKDEIIKYGYTNTGKKYNVSDNTIRKWLKWYEKYGNI
jgi:uncharacterized protein YjcR